MERDPRKTGPNTPEGKAHSSQNSKKHGLCSKACNSLLPGETQEDFDLVWKTWAAEYDSRSPGTARLLELIVNDDRLVRLSTAAVVNAQIALALAEEDTGTTPAHLERLHKDLQTKLRYKTQHERSFRLSLRNIEQFGQRRVREEQAARRLKILEGSTIGNLGIQFKRHGIDYKEVAALLDSFRGTSKPASDQENEPRANPE